jgi:hypothetical protein
MSSAKLAYRRVNLPIFRIDASRTDELNLEDSLLISGPGVVSVLSG